jgi:hypothetical protein
MQPRIYTYKITFEEIPLWYWGVHKEKRYNDGYMGTPKTHKWMWDFYTPKIQILEFFPNTEEGWLEANLIEDQIIRPDLNNPLCLNEGCGGRVSREASQRGGYKMKGVPKTQEHKDKIGKGNKGKKRTVEQCAAISTRNKGKDLTPDQRQRQTESLRKRYQEDPDLRLRKSEDSKGRKWFHDPLTEETRFCRVAPSLEWKEGRPIDYLGAPWWTNGVVNRRSFISPGPGWERGITNDHRKRKFQCTVTGHISSPGGLTKYQKSKGIDVSNRIQIK